MDDTSADSARRVVLSGELNVNRELRVGTFTVGRGATFDLQNGVLPERWADNPNLRRLMEENFDILDIRGMDGLNMNTDRILIIHESAGDDIINWTSEEFVN